MLGINKYILTLIIILLIVLFSYLIYKIIKSIELVKENEEQISNLNDVISSREAVIRQMIKDKDKDKNLRKIKPEKSDQETDYFNDKVPIEVFNDKVSEFNKPVIEGFVSDVHKTYITDIETPIFSNNINVMKCAINKMVDVCTKLSPSNNVISINSSKDMKTIDQLCIDDSENTFSTSSMIKNAIADVHVNIIDSDNDSDNQMSKDINNSINEYEKDSCYNIEIEIAATNTMAGGSNA